MNNFTQISSLKPILLGLNVTATLSIIWLFSVGVSDDLNMSSAIDNSSSEETSLRSEDNNKQRLILADLKARPIFYKSRKSYAPPKRVVNKKVIVAPKPPFALSGVITRPDGSAWVYLQGITDRKVTRAEQGDIISGWRVEKINEKKVVVTFNGTTVELGK